MNSGIYTIKFSNGQFYIGKSENVYNRWKTHQKNFEQGTHTKKMQQAYDECGQPEYIHSLEIHPDHIDIYESVFILNNWGPNLLNTTKPKQISTEDREEYIWVYDNIQNKDKSIMLYSTLEHVLIIKQLHQRVQELAAREPEWYALQLKAKEAELKLLRREASKSWWRKLLDSIGI